MAVPPIDLKQQHEALIPEILGKFEDIMRSGGFILGPEVLKLEEALCQYLGVKHAIGVSSGTDALIAAMMAMGIGVGDEVITSPFTFFASGGSIARLGAKPVFIDIDPVSFNLDPNLIEAAITQNTKAIMPVQLYGLSADMDAVNAIAKKHNLKVIEDAAQSIGSKYNGKMAGGHGDVGCLSFYPTKNLSAMGDAGACVTNDDELAGRIRQIRLHGQSSTYFHDTIGGNFRIDAMQAAVLNVKLPLLDGYAANRRKSAARYNELLKDLPIVTPAESDKCEHVYNQYTIRVLDGKRDALMAHLKENQIAFGMFYPLPLHLQPCFAYLGGKEGDLIHSEQASKEVMSLPNFPEMSKTQQDEVVTAIREFFS